MMVTSSLIELSTDRMGNRVMVREGEGLLRPPPFLQQASGQMFKDDGFVFSSTSDICFMEFSLAQEW